VIECKAVAESSSAVPQHAAEDALEHLVELLIVDGLRSGVGIIHQRGTPSVDGLETLEQHPHVLPYDLYYLQPPHRNRPTYTRTIHIHNYSKSTCCRSTHRAMLFMFTTKLRDHGTRYTVKVKDKV